MTAYGRQRIPGPVDPATVGIVPPTPSDTVALWWANDLPTADGDPVSSWTARVGGQAPSNTGTARPTFRLDGCNGQPGVEFDGSNDVLTLSSSLGSATAGCVVAVCKITTPSAAEVVWGHSSTAGANRYLFGDTYTGSQMFIEQNNGGGSDTVRGGTAVGSSTVTAMEWSSTGSAWEMRLNNTVQTLTTVSGSNSGDWFGDITAPNRFTIGAAELSTGLVAYVAMTISLLVVTSSQLSTADRASLYGWINDTYGL